MKRFRSPLSSRMVQAMQANMEEQEAIKEELTTTNDELRNRNHGRSVAAAVVRL